MKKWNIHLTRNARKQLVNLPKKIQGLADDAMEDLTRQGVNLKGWDVRKTGDDEYRLRLNYRYRMRYRFIREKIVAIEVFYVGHRKDTYR